MTIRTATSLPVALRPLSLASLVVAFALAACGGGGGSDTTKPQPEPSPPPVVPNPPPPAPPPAMSKSNVSLLTGTTAGLGNLNGTGAAARFNGATDVALDAQGNAYVADRNSHQIRKVTRDGVVTTLAGSGVAGYGDGASNVATFCGPKSVAVDANHNVFVVDGVVVRKVSADGMVTTVAGVAPDNCSAVEGLAAPKRPSVLTVDQAGVVYIGNTEPASVYRLTPSGELSVLANIDQRPAYSNWERVSSIVVDRVGNVFLVDQPPPSGFGVPLELLKITPEGLVSRVNRPRDSIFTGGLAVDRSGVVFYSSLLLPVNNVAVPTIWSLSPDGTSTQVASGVSVGRFAIDADGSFWTAQGNLILKLDRTGGVIEVAGQREPSEPKFDGSLAADNAGNVYSLVEVSKENQRFIAALQRITPDGQVTTLLDELDTPSGINTPRGMTADTEGNVYLSTLVKIGDNCGMVVGLCGIAIYGSEVTKIDAQGRSTKLPRTYRDASGNEIGLNRVGALAIDRAGNLYLADRSVLPSGQLTNTSIYRITPAGAISTLASGPFTLNDLAADSQGNVYAGVCAIANRFTGAQIMKYGVDGSAIALAGSPDAAGAADGTGDQARFGSCQLGIGVDRNDNVFVADTANHVVRQVSASGQVSTVVGQPGVQGITLGELPASLSAPTDVSFDGAGTMYVGSAHAILKVQLAK